MTFLAPAHDLAELAKVAENLTTQIATQYDTWININLTISVLTVVFGAISTVLSSIESNGKPYIKFLRISSVLIMTVLAGLTATLNIKDNIAILNKSLMEMANITTEVEMKARTLTDKKEIDADLTRYTVRINQLGFERRKVLGAMGVSAPPPQPPRDQEPPPAGR